MDSSCREGKMGIKKACDTPSLSSTLSSTELSLGHVTRWLSQWLCSSSMYWSSLAGGNSHDLIYNGFCSGFPVSALPTKQNAAFLIVINTNFGYRLEFSTTLREVGVFTCSLPRVLDICSIVMHAKL